MRLVDKLFGGSRILTLGKLHYQSHDGEPVTISKDLRYTIRCGNSLVKNTCVRTEKPQTETSFPFFISRNARFTTCSAV